MASSSGCAPEPVARSSHGAAGRGGRVSRPEGHGSDEQPNALRGRHGPNDASPDPSFPQALRLTSRRQFLAVYENGLKASSPGFTVFGLPNGLAHSRLGLTLTRKTGNAVIRNRAKRVLREAFRLNRHRIGVPMDLVINGRRALLQQSMQRIERDFLACVARIERRVSP